MHTKILEEIGLEKPQIDIYLTLLTFGPLSATKIASETNFYRTNVYRILDALMNRGLVSYVLKNNVKYFSASSPKKLLEDHKRKQRELAELVPKLETLTTLKQEEFKVEVFKAKEGLIALLKFLLREKRDYVVLGDEGKLFDILPQFSNQWLKNAASLGLHGRLLSKESKRGKILHSKNSKIKYLPDEFFSPVMTVVFGHHVAVFDWNQPYHVTLTTSKGMAQGYRNYFEVLWKSAKK